MRPPSQRPRAGRRLLWKTLLIAVVAFFALPTFSTGLDNQVLLRVQLQSISGEFAQSVGVIRGEVSNQIRELPRVVNEVNVSNLVGQIGQAGYNALDAYNDGYKDALCDVRDAIDMYGVSSDDPQQLRGMGGCTDRLIEAWLWGEPTSFDKWLAMTLRRPKISVEYFDVVPAEFVRVPLSFSSQVFPNPRDRLIFTDSSFSGGGSRVRIAELLGGSYTRLNENDANTTACVFGTSAAGASINVTAEGLGGPFNGSDTADSNGNWDLCLIGLNQGYYKFTATDGSRSDDVEQGFARALRSTF